MTFLKSRRGVTLIEAVMAIFLLSTLLAAFLVWIKPHAMMDSTLETQAAAIAQETLEWYSNDPGAILKLMRKGKLDVPKATDRLNLPSAVVEATCEPDKASGLFRITVRVSYQAPWGPQTFRLITLMPPMIAPTDES